MIVPRRKALFIVLSLTGCLLPFHQIHLSVSSPPLPSNQSQGPSVLGFFLLHCTKTCLHSKLILGFSHKHWGLKQWVFLGGGCSLHCYHQMFSSEMIGSVGDLFVCPLHQPLDRRGIVLGWLVVFSWGRGLVTVVSSSPYYFTR